MTHIPSVAETFSWLGDTVADCKARCAPAHLTFTILADGIQVCARRGPLADCVHVTWEKLIENPNWLTFKAGEAVGALDRMTARSPSTDPTPAPQE